MTDDDWGDDGDGGDGDDWGDDDAGDAGWGEDAGAGDDWGDMGGGDMGGGDEEDWRIEVENLYYTAESERKDDPTAALEKLQKCVEIEEANGGDEIDKRFLALSYIVTLQFSVGETAQMVDSFKKLLGYASNPNVSPNDLNNAIQKILNSVQDSADAKALSTMYEITLDFFKSQGKDRFWFDYAMRLCKTYFDNADLASCNALLDELHAKCRTPGGEDDKSKGAQLLEIYAIRIQVMSAKNDQVAIRELYERTRLLVSDISDPKSMSIIKECWGKMYASNNDWVSAYNNFYEAFRMYQDIGSYQVIQCLKYVVLSSMLSPTGQDPFATQEAGVYQSNADIIPMADLLDAFQNNNIKKFEGLLFTKKKDILNDSFIVEHMPAVKLKLRSAVLIKLIKPYKRVRLSWLERRLGGATKQEVENLVVNLILDGSIQGRIDQIQGLLDLNFLTSTDAVYASMENWVRSVDRLRSEMASKSGRMESGRGGMGMGMPMLGAWDDFEDPFIEDIDPGVWSF